MQGAADKISALLISVLNCSSIDLRLGIIREMSEL